MKTCIKCGLEADGKTVWNGTVYHPDCLHAHKKAMQITTIGPFTLKTGQTVIVETRHSAKITDPIRCAARDTRNPANIVGFGKTPDEAIGNLVMRDAVWCDMDEPAPQVSHAGLLEGN